MFRVDDYYFSLSEGSGGNEEQINYIDYSTLTAKNGVVEIDNKEGTNTIFIPSSASSDFVFNDDSKLCIKFKNLIPCKLIIVSDKMPKENYIIDIRNFFKSSILISPTSDVNILWGYCVDMEDTLENFVDVNTSRYNKTISIYGMFEQEYKYNGVLKKEYLINISHYETGEM